MTFDEFSSTVRILFEQGQANAKYLEGLPFQVREFLVTNSLAESLYSQVECLGKAAFGPMWPDVAWFLQDWQPGFEIVVGQPPEEVKRYPIGGLDDYLAYAKEQLFS